MEREAYGRWADDPRPGSGEVNTPPGYSATAQGEVRRAPLYESGRLVGHVWTDDQDAAGFLAAEDAGAAGVLADARVWTILHDLYEAGVQATDVLDPDFFEGFELKS